MAGQSRRTKVDVDSRAFERGLKDALAKFSVSTEAELFKVGNEVRNAAVRYTPVDTGVLRSGWQVEKGHDAKGHYVDVLNPTEYAADVELGHDTETGKHVPPQAMIRPALAEVTGMQGIGYDVKRSE